MVWDFNYFFWGGGSVCVCVCGGGVDGADILLGGLWSSYVGIIQYFGSEVFTVEWPQQSPECNNQDLNWLQQL